MASTPLRIEHRLDGASKFLSWKTRVTLVLKEYDLWELVDKEIFPLIDLTTLEVHEKKDIKVEMVILNSMKDHLIPHLSKKNVSKYMFDAFVGLFQRTNMNKKMVLRNELRSMQMFISDNVINYFMRITQVHDQITSIGEKNEDIENMNVALNSLHKSWEPFFKGFCTREHLRDW
jgi:hypothetical protein